MPFKKYEVLEHPAELRIKVYGKTLEELFSNAVLAMAQILKGDTNMNKVHIENNFSIQQMHTNDTNRKEVQVESIDINSLLVDFLNDILALSQINKAVYDANTIKIVCHPELLNCKAITRSGVIGSVSGFHNWGHGNNYEMPKQVRHDEGVDPQCIIKATLIGYPVDHFDEDIKAVTYEDLDIKQIDRVWQAVIVFDI